MMISATHPEIPVKADITIRPVVIPDDIPWIEQWTGLDADCLIPFYESIAASSFMQSMMVWDNEQPVFQVDICEAIFDDFGAGDAGPGDFTLRFQFPADAPVPVIHQGLYNCLHYMFLEKNARRILMPVHKSNKILLDWVKDARFALVTGMVHKPQYPLYVLTA